MRNVENKKSLFAGVGADSKYRCNLCGHLTKVMVSVAHTVEPLFPFIQQQM